MPARARCYTDPACSASWAAEPKRRALLVEFGKDLSFTYVMGGLARDYEDRYSDPSAGVEPGRTIRVPTAHWLEHAADSRMPFDPRLWSEGPIRSSFPACMAVKAAAEQGPAAEERYLRAVREGLMCFRRKLDSAEPLVEVAREAGLDVRRFRVDLQSNAIVEAFGADLEETRAPPTPRASGTGCRTPRAVSASCSRHCGSKGTAPSPLTSSAMRPTRNCARPAIAAGGRPSDEPRPDPLAALRRFGRLATVEVEAVCDLSAQTAEGDLWRLAAEGRARPLRVLTGDLWELA